MYVYINVPTDNTRNRFASSRKKIFVHSYKTHTTLSDSKHEREEQEYPKAKDTIWNKSKY